MSLLCERSSGGFPRHAEESQLVCEQHAMNVRSCFKTKGRRHWFADHHCQSKTSPACTAIEKTSMRTGIVTAVDHEWNIHIRRALSVSFPIFSQTPVEPIMVEHSL
jgi:exosortase/archaeosortase